MPTSPAATLARIAALLLLPPLGLRLVGVIDWPWVWAAAPLWIVAAVIVYYAIRIGFEEWGVSNQQWRRRR